MTVGEKFDVIIIGGGLYGCSTAFHLLSRERDLRIAVVELDPAYTHAASARSNAGVRIQFSQAESIRMSQFGHQFYADFGALMAVDGEQPALTLNRRGYLIMATQPRQVADMEANLEVQRSLGCNVEVHDAASLARLRPSLHTDDVLMATYSPDDMWIDPYGAVTAMMHKVRDLGVELVQGEVVGLDGAYERLDAVLLADGTRIEGDWVVHTTGAWAPTLCAELGITLPVQPLPLMAFYFETREELEPFGVTIDQGRVSFRPEGRGYITLRHRPEDLGSFRWEADMSVFEEQNWPLLAHRVPAFESLKVMNSYCCHYAQNTFDGNLLLGRWPGKPANYLLATGASGHGLQHAPAAGRGLAELILDGRFTTLDLGRFGCDRVVENRPDPERGFVA